MRDILMSWRPRGWRKDLVFGSAAAVSFLVGCGAGSIGNSGSVDTEPPSVTIGAPLDGAVVTGNITVSGTASDDTLVSTVELAVDSEPYSPVTGTSSWTHDVDTTLLTAGAHGLAVRATDSSGNVAQASVSIYVFVGQPVATLTGAPPSLTNVAALNVTVGGDGVVAYTYALDAGSVIGPVDVAVPITDTVSEGAHVLQVFAQHESGASQTTPTEVSWTVDQKPPETVATGAPTGVTNLTEATLDVSDADTAAFDYSVVGSVSGALASGAAEDPAGADDIVLTALADEEITVSITAYDLAGNGDPTPLILSWTVDTLAPDTAITSGVPADPTNVTSLSVDVADELTSFDYTLVGSSSGTIAEGTGVSAAGAANIVASGLSEETFTLTVTGHDAAGNADPSPWVFSWTVDVTPPDTAVNGLPSNPTNASAIDLDVAETDLVSFSYDLVDGTGASVAGGTDLDPQGASDIVITGLTDDDYTLTVTGFDAAGNADPTPFSYSWTIDGAPPETTLASGTPADPTNVNSLDIDVDDGLTTFDFSLSGASAGPVDGGSGLSASGASNITATGLGEDTYTLTVTGYDSAGNPDPTPLVIVWTVDLTEPDTSVTGAPTSPTSSDGATFDVLDGDVVAYDVTVTGVSAGTVLSESGRDPAGSADIDLTGLADDTYTITVTGYDAAGNSDSSPYSATWTVDTAAPDTAASGIPNDPDNQTTVAIDVDDTDAAAFSYTVTGSISGPLEQGTDLDPAGTDDIVLTGLIEETITLSITASDAAGNADPTPLVATWSIDLQPPDTVVTGTPASLVTTNSATFDVDPTDLATFQYSLVGSISGSIAVESGLDPAGTDDIVLTELGDETFTLIVAGYDAAGNYDPTPYTAVWTVDTQPPVAVLGGTPADPTTATDVNVTVSGTDVVWYRYRLDGGAWSADTAPGTAIVETDLGGGSHTLEVIGRDAAGNWQDTGSATTHGWTIDLSPPTAVLTNTPPHPTALRDIDVTVGGTDVVAYRYRIDGASWTTEYPVSTHIIVTGLADGPHSLDVVGKDTVGNWQDTASPTSHSWTITQTTLSLMVSPQNGSVLLPDEAVVIDFNLAPDTATLAASGSLVAAAYASAWSLSDTRLTLTPTTTWNTGLHQTLIIQIDDEFGRTLLSEVVFDVITSSDFVYVSTSTGSDTTGDGTVDNPFATITTGLANVPSAGAVFVAEGVYAESVTIDAPASIYGGYSTDFLTRHTQVYPTTIEGTSTDGGTGTDPMTAVAVTAAGVVDGFDITGGGGTLTTAFFSDAGAPIIRHSTLRPGSGTSRYPVIVRASSAAVLYGNTIPNDGSSGTCLVVSDATNPVRIERNVVTGWCLPLVVTGEDVTIRENEIQPSGFTATWAVSLSGMSGTSYILFDGNTIDLPTSGSQYNLTVIADAGKVADITNNTITGGYAQNDLKGIFGGALVQDNTLALGSANVIFGIDYAGSVIGNDVQYTGTAFTGVIYGIYRSAESHDNIVGSDAKPVTYGVWNGCDCTGNDITIQYRLSSGLRQNFVSGVVLNVANNTIRASGSPQFTARGIVTVGDVGSITTGNVMENIGTGISAAAGNFVYDNTIQGVAGIDSNVGAEGAVYNNIIDVSGTGIAIETGIQPVYDNHITCGGVGIWAHRQVILERNVIQGCSTGVVFLNNVLTSTVRNNLIAVSSLGFEFRGAVGGTAVIENNTVFVGERAGHFYDDQTVFLRNNIFVASAGTYGFDEWTFGSAAAATIENNLFYGFPTILWSDGAGCVSNGDGDNNPDTCTLSEMESEAAIAAASGNIEAAPLLVSEGGTDASYLTLDDNDWRPSDASPCELVEGGQDGATAGWGYDEDFEQATRDATTTCSPANTGAEGWSMGAYEY